ncbi:MAG: hypothetical protein VX569_11240 [Pseudomonadota bacterium]|jgi:hypothetical protein|nr:hypothetical protein [Pseudomonadota bacterium]
MFRKALAAIATAAIAGCATAGDLDQREAQISYETSKSPGELEECIALALANAGTPSTIRTENRRIMVWEEGGFTMWTITIHEADPTRAEMRWGGPILSGKWRNRFRNCA